MFKDEWEKKRIMIEKALISELHAGKVLSPRLTEAMEYSLMAGGKRLRPVLLTSAAEAAGGHGEDVLTAAAAIEMIHTYSLIHDDLPAMDNDDYRRGRLTNHKVYGAGMATLAGDGLLTLAFEVLTRQKGAPEAIVKIISEISEMAGSAGMVGGQAIDLESEGKKIDRETLKKMHAGKTGALFRASVRAGALLAGADGNTLSALTRYSEFFGLAFQITDDILDVTGDEKTIGKPVGSDERNMKSTYVTLTSLDEARTLAKEAADEAKRALSPIGTRAEFLAELSDYIISRDR